eukprot:355439_1
MANYLQSDDGGSAQNAECIPPTEFCTRIVTVIAPKPNSIHCNNTLILIANCIRNTLKATIVVPLTLHQLILNYILNDTLSPIQYIIDLPSSSTISELKDKLELLTELAKERLIVCVVWNNNVYNVLRDDYLIDKICDTDTIHCYDVPTDRELRMTLFKDAGKFKLVYIVHQKTSVPLGFVCFGVPLVIKLPVEYDIDTELLIDYMKCQIEPFCESDNQCTFVALDKYSRSCGICNCGQYGGGCEGCELNKLTENILRIPDMIWKQITIGIRWKLDGENCFDHKIFTTPNIHKPECWMQTAVHFEGT